MTLRGAHILLFFIFLPACRCQAGTPCPSSSWQVMNDNMCVLFVEDYQLTAGQASDYCVNQGSSLLRFSNSDSVGQFAALATVRSTDGWWSDLNDLDQPGTWTWGGNQRIASGALAWAKEPTDTHHVENCITIDSSGLLSDDDCSRPMGYICSFTFNIPDDCTDGFMVGGEQCYYPSRLDDPGQLVNWSVAIQSCQHLAAAAGKPTPVLATFTTTAQFQGLQQLMGELSTSGKRWVGLNDRAKENYWQWSDNSLVDDTSFFDREWKSYPDLGSGKSCGMVHSDGHMEEANCEDVHYFVCEFNISPDSFFLEFGFGCPAPWIRGGNKCYLFNSNQSLSHDDTLSFCANMQGRLLKVENADERDWVKQQTISGHMFNMWTGLKRNSNGGTTQWLWNDGSATDVDLLEWVKQPSGSTNEGENCAFINTNGVYNYANCFLRLSFICELKTEDTPCPNNWLSAENDDMTSCYYLSIDQTGTWQQALSKCRQLSGMQEAHLVAIASENELDYMISLMTANPYTGYWTDLVSDSWVGGDWSFSQSYEGTPPPISWDKEPNNFEGNENCAVLYTEGRYSDVSCSSKAHVLCERSSTVGNGLTSGKTASAVLKKPSWALLPVLYVTVFWLLS